MCSHIYCIFTADKPLISKPKEKLPPRPPKDKPEVSDVADSALTISWTASEIPSYAEQTEIW